VGDNVSNEKIWENGEKSTIAAAILCVVADNAKRLNDFTNKLTVGGRCGMRFNLFLQSVEQLTEKYNKETAAIPIFPQRRGKNRFQVFGLSSNFFLI